MQIIRTTREMHGIVKYWKATRRTIGLVPTMGALHAGHRSLMDTADARTEEVVVSVFVNPTQFGPNEDYANYPRNLAKDEAFCKAAGVSVLFVPNPAEMYPQGYSTWVDEDTLGLGFEGAQRPGHFRGVTTIVAKLFNIVQPEVAVFGQKDVQQALIIQRMARDLDYPIRVVIAPTVREADGLAMSSRNAYLSSEHRQAATAIHRGLSAAVAAHRQGERQAATLLQLVQAPIVASGGAPDYVALVNPDTLKPVDDTLKGRGLIVVTARYGTTRLLDNSFLEA